MAFQNLHESVRLNNVLLTQTHKFKWCNMHSFLRSTTKNKESHKTSQKKKLILFQLNILSLQSSLETFLLLHSIEGNYIFILIFEQKGMLIVSYAMAVRVIFTKNEYKFWSRIR